MPEHKNIISDERHPPFRQIFADEAARLADATVYPAEELYAIALQEDIDRLYYLSSISPVTWTALGYALGSATYQSEDPTGFPAGEDVKASLSVDAPTRTFSIQPVATSFDIVQAGKVYTKSALETVVWPNIEGLHYFYFDKDDQTLKTTTAFDTFLLSSHVWIANIYWDASNSAVIYFGNERHGAEMSYETHRHLHTCFGAAIKNAPLGFTPTLLSPAGSAGNVDADAELSITHGILRDEDIENDSSDSSQTVSPVAQIPVFYRDGAAGDWRKRAANNFPMIYSGDGSGYVGGSGLVAWNELTGGVWQLTELPNNDYVLIHLFATNDINEPIVAIQGQAAYATEPAAEAGAEQEIFDLDGFPFLEWAPICTLIVQTGTTKGNTPKASFEATAAGRDFEDWRKRKTF